MTKLLIKNVQALVADGSVQTVDIAIENEKIIKIGQISENWQADEIINGQYKFAIPGFVNAHTHAEMTLLRSYADDMNLMDWLQNKIWPIEAKMSDEDIYWGTMLAIAEMVKSGTTTFADMYASMEEVAAAVEETGIRAVLSRGMIGVAPTGEKALVEAADLFKNYHNKADGRITVMLGPHAPYTCPPEYLETVVAISKDLKAEIHIHLAETLFEVGECQKQYGKSPIELMEATGILQRGVLAAHCVHLSDNDISLMKKYNVRVAHNPGSNMKLASGIAPVHKMLQAGLCVGLGTDGASSNNNLDMLEELRLATLLHKVNTLDPLVVPAYEGVLMATKYGAEAVGLKDTVGILAEGYKADITLFDTNNLWWTPQNDKISLLAYSANSSQVDTVIVNGKILMNKGQLLTMDEEKILYEVNKRATALMK